MQMEATKDKWVGVTVEKTVRGQACYLFKSAPSSPDTTNHKKRSHTGDKIHPRENEEEKRNSPPLKMRKMDDSDQYTPAKVETRTCRSPSSSSPDSSITQKSINRQVSDEVVSRNMDFDDEAASPENKLIQHLTKLSEMEPSLKRTDSLVFDLLTDPKFADACIDVARGMKQLKEGLTTITKARELLRERTKSK